MVHLMLVCIKLAVIIHNLSPNHLVTKKFTSQAPQYKEDVLFQFFGFQKETDTLTVTSFWQWWPYVLLNCFCHKVNGMIEVITNLSFIKFLMCWRTDRNLFTNRKLVNFYSCNTLHKKASLAENFCYSSLYT